MAYAYSLYLTVPGQPSVDVTELAQSVTWSGNTGQVGRELQATLAIPKDGSVPPPPLKQGALVTLRSGGVSRFLGPLLGATTDSQSSAVDLSALDRAWYLTQNEGWYKFSKVTPEQALATIAATYGIPLGTVAKTGIAVSRKFPGVSLDKILGTLYTLAAAQSGKRYLLGFDGNGRLTVRERREAAALTVEATMGVTNGWDIAKLQNSVAIRTESGALVRRVEDTASIAMSGRLEHVLMQAKGKDVGAEAKAWLEDHGLQQKLTVQCQGDARLITGEAVELRDTGSGVSGLFWIDADSHCWRNGVYTTKLTLNFRNLMNETKAGSELK